MKNPTYFIIAKTDMYDFITIRQITFDILEYKNIFFKDACSFNSGYLTFFLIGPITWRERERKGLYVQSTQIGYIRTSKA